MTDYTDLIAQMAGRARFCRDRGEVKTPDILDEAADAIAALQAEVARITAPTHPTPDAQADKG